MQVDVNEIVKNLIIESTILILIDVVIDRDIKGTDFLLLAIMETGKNIVKGGQ